MTPQRESDQKRDVWLVDQRTKSEFFHQRLHEYGLLSVAYAIEEIRGETLDWDLSSLAITEKAWNKIIHQGIKPVRAFAHPHVLMTVPRATGYYRGLSMVSQKSMNNIRLPVYRFEDGRATPDEEKALAIAIRLNQLISPLVETDQRVDPREFDLWRGMTAGSQAQGSWQNKKGDIAEELVKNLIESHIRDSNLIDDTIALESTILLQDGRKVVFGYEPDIAVYDTSDKIISAVEIKGGIDPAGVLERVGAAIKSLSRAKQENSSALTILILYAVSMTPQAEADLQAHERDIDYWYALEDVLNEGEVLESILSLLSL